MNTTRTLALTGLAVLATASFGLPAASAKDGDVVTRGTCSSGATWKLKAGHRDGRIEIEFEVDSNRNGQTWNVTLTQDGVRVASGTRVTQAPSGSFQFRRVLPDTAGSDALVARATRVGTTQTCTGRVTV
jgi:hypothetical protein